MGEAEEDLQQSLAHFPNPQASPYPAQLLLDTGSLIKTGAG